MKVKVRKWDQGKAGSRTVALDAWFLWRIGHMRGADFQRIALKYGKEHWLYNPSIHGELCPSNGEHPGIECCCDECDYALACFPEYT